MKKYKIRLNFIYDDENDLSQIVEVDERLYKIDKIGGYSIENKIPEVLQQWKKELYDKMDTEDAYDGCDTDYYQEKLEQDDRFTLISEDLDDFINFNY